LKEIPARTPDEERRTKKMENEITLVIGAAALAINLLLMTLVIRYAINQSKLTGQLAELIDEVRMLRRELAKEKPRVIDKRV
jgi:hypothetical protein